MEILSEVLGWLFPNSEMMVVYLLSLAGGVIILGGGYLLSIRSSRAIAVEREREKFERLVNLVVKDQEGLSKDSRAKLEELAGFDALYWKAIRKEAEGSARSIEKLNKSLEDYFETVRLDDVGDALNSPGSSRVKVSRDQLTGRVWGQDVHVTPVEEQRAGDTRQDSPAQEQPPRPRAPDRP